MRSTNRRKVTASIAVFATASLLVACGGNGDADSDDEGDDDTSQTDDDETDTDETDTDDAGDDESDTDDAGDDDAAGSGDWPDLSGENLDVAADWSGDEQANFEEVLSAFEDATGASTTYTSLGNNVSTALGTQIEGGSPPNIALIPQPGLMDQLAADGNIYPVTDDVLSSVEENFAETWVDLGSVDDDVYGVWYKAANKSTVWYNVQVYEDAGAEIPETWEDFTDTLQLISDSGVPGLSVGADVGWPLTDWFENVYLQVGGPDMYDQLADHEIPWTDDTVVESLELLAELWGDEQLLLDGGGQRSFPESVTEVFNEPPSAGTVYEGDFVAGVISGETDSVVGEDADFYPFPQIGDADASVMGAGNVAVAFDEDEATMALMEYLASPEAADIWIELGGFTSPNQNADMDLYPDEISLAIAEQLVEAETFRFDLSDLAPSAFGGTEGEGMWQILIDFYNDPSDPEGTAQALEDAAEAAY